MLVERLKCFGGLLFGFAKKKVLEKRKLRSEQGRTGMIVRNRTVMEITRGCTDARTDEHKKVRTQGFRDARSKSESFLQKEHVNMSEAK